MAAVCPARSRRSKSRRAPASRPPAAALRARYAGAPAHRSRRSDRMTTSEVAVAQRAAVRRGRDRRARASLSGRDVPQQGLAHAARRHHQLGRGDHRHRHVGRPSAARRPRSLPVVLVSLLVAVFLIFEGRRYRYFDIWRTRVRVMEASFYGPILRGQGLSHGERLEPGAGRRLHRPLLPHQLLEAAGRRLRRNYCWIFGVQIVSFWGKICIHPTPLASLEQLWSARSVGPLLGPGRAADRRRSSTSACSRSAS